MIEALVACVEYDDLLAITLPRMLSLVDRCIVVSSFKDTLTAAVVRDNPKAELYRTEAFYADGAAFNKGLAIEEARKLLGPNCWTLFWDADILLPEWTRWSFMKRNILYGAQRVVLKDVHEYSPKLDWQDLDYDGAPPGLGYFQLFHSRSWQIRYQPRWHGVESAHPGISDMEFRSLWPERTMQWSPFKVLHLGPTGTNWFGRVSDRLDGLPLQNRTERAVKMDAIKQQYGWKEED